MSMFKKMKDRITDEVSSATNKLQNMQLMDQLASTIGPQSTLANQTPNQILPDPGDLNFTVVSNPRSDNLNSIYDDENSEKSPQHQLFNEMAIKRLVPTNVETSNNTSMVATNNSDQLHNVIDIFSLSSDIEEDIEDPLDSTNGSPDAEIDLLTNEPIVGTSESSRFPSDRLNRFRAKYKDIVHATRLMNSVFLEEKSRLNLINNDLMTQISSLRREIDSMKHASLDSSSTVTSEKSNADNPPPSTKSSAKLRDLEKLLTKCKESLKQKNAQLQILKNSLMEVENFKEYNQELKRELADLKRAHETWTVSIAENKRSMHQEIENKNIEMERQRSETSELQARLTDSQNKTKQLKIAIQDLESRLVSTSAAHQKERESLSKELNSIKNNAIKQLKKEHDHHLERVKLDLEKSIEALKLELLAKDEQIMNNAKYQEEMTSKVQELTSNIQDLTKDLDESRNNLESSYQKIQELDEASRQKEECIEKMKQELESAQLTLKRFENSEQDSDNLLHQLDDLRRTLQDSEDEKGRLTQRISELEVSSTDSQSKYLELEAELSKKTEVFQQRIHELTTDLGLMATANLDQEKEIQSLREQRDNLLNSTKLLKVEIEELCSKNECLSRMIEEKDMDIRNVQEQIDRLSTMQQELEASKKMNIALEETSNRLRIELDDKKNELHKIEADYESNVKRSSDLQLELDECKNTIEELKSERLNHISLVEHEAKLRREQDEQLIVKIIAAMKNLESPTSSPGSDKSLDSVKLNDSRSLGGTLPNPLKLIEELSSIALDKSNSHVTTNQRLQAAMLESSALSDEIERLKGELNDLNHEKAMETKRSLNEVERLQVENEALVHDQNVYDDEIAALKEEIKNLSEELELKSSQKLEVNQEEYNTNATMHKDIAPVPDSTEFEYLKNIGKYGDISCLRSCHDYSVLTFPSISLQFINLC